MGDEKIDENIIKIIDSYAEKKNLSRDTRDKIIQQVERSDSSIFQNLNMEILGINETKIEFVLHDTTIEFANEFRKAIISEVPTMAIKKVEFETNESILQNELITQRLGLIPL